MFNLFAETTSALGFLEKIEVVHRDIKPGNKMRSLLGKFKIVDFGEIKYKD